MYDGLPRPSEYEERSEIDGLGRPSYGRVAILKYALTLHALKLGSMKRFTLFAFCFLATFQSSRAAEEQNERAERLNIVMIAIDDLNDWVEPLGGHPDVKTPAMKRLAQRGLTFTNAHCQAPLCNPSRTSLMTGRRPTSNPRAPVPRVPLARLSRSALLAPGLEG